MSRLHSSAMRHRRKRGDMSELTTDSRIAAATAASVTGPVTLMNRFVVPAPRDQEFEAMWTRTSEYFVARPGFVSLRLHRAVSADATHRWVNVANWACQADYRAAHATEEFRRLVGQPGWQEFPSFPTLFEVVTSIG